MERKLLQANNEITFCFKTPSCIHKVNYDQRVNELWETDPTKDYKKTRKHHLWIAIKITQHRTEELLF